MKQNSWRTTCRVRRHGSDPSRCLPPEDGFSSRILPGCTIERIKRELPNQDRPSASAGQRHAVRRKAFRVPERPSLQAADDVEGAVVFEARTIGVMHRPRESEPDSCVSMITVDAARCARPEAFAPKRVVRLPRWGATTHRSKAMRRMCRATSSRSLHRDAGWRGSPRRWSRCRGRRRRWQHSGEAHSHRRQDEGCPVAEVRKGAAHRLSDPCFGEGTASGRIRRKLARLEGFEPPTNGFGSRYSIRLSYRRVTAIVPDSGGRREPPPSVTVPR